MAQTKIKYCNKCHATKEIKKVGKSTIADGFGFVRGIIAIASLGISETVGATHYYQCEKCGNIKQID